VLALPWCVCATGALFAHPPSNWTLCTDTIHIVDVDYGTLAVLGWLLSILPFT
jgi:hypothetical protein